MAGLRSDGERAVVPGGDVAIILRDVGLLVAVLGLAMVVPIAVAVGYGEIHTAIALAISGASALLVGAASRWVFRAAGDATERHALLIAALGWLAIASFGALPFSLAAYITPDDVLASFVPPGADYVSSIEYLRHPLHALFESTSAYTTTGLTMVVHEPSVGRGLLFYRSYAQWLGGVGVIVLSLAILRWPAATSRIALYQSESAGVRLRPSVLGTARAIWRIYIGLTLASAAYLFVGTLILLPGYDVGAALFDAVNHAMAAQSTGGFSTLDDSIAGYGSFAMEILHIPPMMLGAISIPLSYEILRKRDAGVVIRDAQTRTALLIVACGAPALTLMLAGAHADPDPVRSGVFQFVSALTTTGWQTTNIGAWSDSAILLLALGPMLVGGSAGATVGGIKLVRVYLIARGVSWRVQHLFLPREAVVAIRLGARTLSSKEMAVTLADAATFTLLYLAIAGAAVVLVSGVISPDVSLAAVVFEVLSAQSTVGLSSNLTSPDMSPVVEVTFIVLMWVGRLEIIPVLVLFRAFFKGFKS